MSDNVQLFKFVDSSPPMTPDLVNLGRFYKPGSRATNHNILLQVRSPAGLPASVQAAYLFAQTMPPYQLFEAGGASLSSIAYDSQYHEILTTPWDFIDPISLGLPGTSNSQFRSWIGGLAFASLSNQRVMPTVWRLDIQREGFPSFNFDLGEQAGSPSDLGSRLVTDIGGGCGDCGWFSTSRYRIVLSARSNCVSPGSSSAGVARATVQMLMLPSNFASPVKCGTGVQWRDCCNAQPDCSWSCSVGSLPLDSDVANFVCP